MSMIISSNIIDDRRGIVSHTSGRGGVLEDVLGVENVLEDTFSSPWLWPRSLKSYKSAYCISWQFLIRVFSVNLRQFRLCKSLKFFGSLGTAPNPSEGAYSAPPDHLFNSIQFICSLDFNFQKLNTNKKNNNNKYPHAQIEWTLMPIKEINVG